MLRAALRRGRVELRVTRQGLQGEPTLSQEVAEPAASWQLASSWIPGPQPPPTRLAPCPARCDRDLSEAQKSGSWSSWRTPHEQR